MQPFRYTRPHINLDITVTATPHAAVDREVWLLEAVGTVHGQPVEYSERWFETSDAVVRSVQTADDVFYLSLLSYEAMETYEAESLKGI